MAIIGIRSGKNTFFELDKKVAKTRIPELHYITSALKIAGTLDEEIINNYSNSDYMRMFKVPLKLTEAVHTPEKVGVALMVALDLIEDEDAIFVVAKNKDLVEELLEMFDAELMEDNKVKIYFNNNVERRFFERWIKTEASLHIRDENGELIGRVL